MRALRWPGCSNARDLGDLPTHDGARIRRGALLRSGTHDGLTEAGIAAVRACGVGRIVDLRSPPECALRPSPFAGTELYHNASLLDLADERGLAAYAAAQDPGAASAVLLEWFGHLVGAAVAALADAPGGAVVVHCHAGKDRTGLVVALALAVAGVAPAVIAEDYALSDAQLEELYAQEIAAAPDPEVCERMRAFHTSQPETILAVLRELEDRYGGVDAYLAERGLTDEAGVRLRARLRDETGAPG